MTATATYHTVPGANSSPPQPAFSSPFSFSAPFSPASVGEQLHGQSRTDHARVGLKRSLTTGTSLSTSSGRTQKTEPRPHSWLRRFSSMSRSRESSPAPPSHQESSAVSHRHASGEHSTSGSTTPVLPSSRTPSYTRNKLVKRTSSVRSSTSSPFQSRESSGSRLPLPTFKRPATSHSRSATWQHSADKQREGERASLDPTILRGRDQQWQHYFTPRVSASGLVDGDRRHSTGIPNPIKRIYPNRKHTPVLLSGREPVRSLRTELDDDIDSQDDGDHNTTGVASSPLAAKPAESDLPRRSFSIGDLLSTGPQQLWKRPSSSRGRLPTPKSRKNVRGSGSNAQTAMGHALSGVSERPAKRRDITGLATSQHNLPSSRSSQTYNPQSREIDLGLASATPLGNESGQYLASSDAAPSPPTPPRRLASDQTTASGHPPRLSAAQSEVPSTVGSDSDQKSFGDESTDYQSDNPYDSYPTRTTRSSSGRRGPPIDTIFDDSPSNFSGRSTKLADLLSDASVPGSDHGARFRHSTIEEEGSVVSTPVRSLRSHRERSGTPSTVGHDVARKLFDSSPPAIPTMPDPDDIDWDAPGDGDTSSAGSEAPKALQNPFANAHPISLGLGSFMRSQHSSSAVSTPQRNGLNTMDKASIFDWSEEQPSPSHYNQSPPRPKTVHGKKDPETRGSRAAGRRPPSGMHARSHSVPVVPDADGKRNNAVANKFGTWGVGSKGVTEDWNEDFDFEPAAPAIPVHLQDDGRRVDSGHEMFVPKSIRDQQENVVANIGLLREWGLLIEELKELRIRAVALDMMQGTHAMAWQEVDAMIELADQETEEKTLDPQISPPSSPGFDYDVFDETEPPIALASKARRPSVLRAPLTAPIPEAEAVDAVDLQVQHLPNPPLVVRPRRDSEAVARSVIAALQTKRTNTAPRDPTSKKVPFDTATLRHIVPYVNGLKRKVKDALRETEGLYSSPRRPAHVLGRGGDLQADEEPAFHSIFKGPQPGSPSTQRHARRSYANTDHDGFHHDYTAGAPDSGDDLAASLQAMSFSPPTKVAHARHA